MDQDETWLEVGLDPDHIVLDGDPAPPPPPRKGHSSPNFRSMWPNGRPPQLLLSTGSIRELGRETKKYSWESFTVFISVVWKLGCSNFK